MTQLSATINPGFKIQDMCVPPCVCLSIRSSVHLPMLQVISEGIRHPAVARPCLRGPILFLKQGLIQRDGARGVIAPYTNRGNVPQFSLLGAPDIAKIATKIFTQDCPRMHHFIVNIHKFLGEDPQAPTSIYNFEQLAHTDADIFPV